MYYCLNRAVTGGKLSLDEFVQLAADSGFDGADVDLKYAQEHGVAALRDCFASRNQRFGGWGPPGDWRGQEAQHADLLNTLPSFASYARQLNIDSCATWIMPSSDRPFSENWNFHVSRLKHVAAVLAEQGLRLGLEFVAPYHLRRRFAHEFIFTPGLMLELADACGSNVGLLVDSFHCHCAGTTWEHLAMIPAQRIVLVHLNDAPKVPVAEAQDGVRVLPGDGVIDVSGFLKAVAATGYAGPVSLEVISQELSKLNPAQAAARAGQALP